MGLFVRMEGCLWCGVLSSEGDVGMDLREERVSVDNIISKDFVNCD